MTSRTGKKPRKKSFQLNEELEQRVQRRTAQLEAANQELESFSYSVSHDLRAPLRAIDGFSRILLSDHADRLDTEGQRLLGIIRTNTRNMGQLIDDLLAFSQLGRREVKAADLDMGTLVQEVVIELQDTLGDRTVQWNLKSLPATRADRALMHQVWVNLLGNALKFTRPRESAVIEVGCRSAAHEDVYYVKDNGVGFDMQYAHKLFGVFQRLHRYEEFEGTGVGLALVQRIVQRHGGRVWAEGQVNGGATFLFLPAPSPGRPGGIWMRPADLHRPGCWGWQGKIFAVKANVNLASQRFNPHYTRVINPKVCGSPPREAGRYG